jgi:hypothetical protein
MNIRRPCTLHYREWISAFCGRFAVTASQKKRPYDLRASRTNNILRQ